MNRDSADFSEWADEEFGERETPFMAFITAMLAITFIALLGIIVKLALA